MATDNENNVVIAKQLNGSVVITYFGRNKFVATLATLIASLPAFACLILAFLGLTEGQFDTALMFVAASAGLLWVVWRFGWRKKRYRILFDDKCIQFGTNRLAYAGVSEIIVGYDGGAPFDPGSMPVPRNTTPGFHVAVKALGQWIPITVAISRKEAQTVRDASTEIWRQFTTRSMNN